MRLGEFRIVVGRPTNFRDTGGVGDSEIALGIDGTRQLHSELAAFVRGKNLLRGGGGGG